MDKERFDCQGFFNALDIKRKELGLNWQKVAIQAKVSASTLTRMAQGKRPDVDTMAALATWGGLTVDTFIGGAENNLEADSTQKIRACLRADPNLSKEAAEAIEQILLAAIQGFRR